MKAANQINRIFLGIIFFVFLCASTNLQAQENHLNKKIAVSFNNVPVEEALLLIGHAGNFNFSYNSDIIDQHRRLTLTVKKRSVHRILKDLFRDKYKFKAVGKHVIILEEKKAERTSGSSKNEYTISGFVIDSKTGERIKNATIYEFDERLVTVSNDEGFYSMAIPDADLNRGINFSKYGYEDTVIILQGSKEKQVNIVLNRDNYKLTKISSKQAEIKPPNIHDRKLVKLIVSEEDKSIAENLNIYDTRLFQVSLLPYVGTNHKLSGSVDNVISLNILAGYAKGVRGVELGGLANIDRKNVYGAQIAGIGNYVGNRTDGLQMAGIANVNIGKLTGVQMAGIHNLVLDTLSGLQLAGIQNVLHGEMKGVQLAGITNLSTKSVDGAQLAGFVNVAFNDVNLAQIAGFVNYGRNIEGAQLAGAVNFALGDVNKLQLAGMLNFGKNVNGAQLAGYGNFAYGDVNAAQLAGLFNYTKNIEGFQLAGLLNMALKDVNRSQVAGLVNIAGGNVNQSQIAGLLNLGNNVYGFQAAAIANGVYGENDEGQFSGIANYANKVEGVQVSGMVNVALQEVDGAQVAGFVNYTRKLNGVQIGFVNICDTVESGLPIGLFSFVRKGYNKIEISADEVSPVNVGVKIGVQKLYNIIKVGYDFKNTYKLTLGLGTDFNLNEKTGMNIDMTFNRIRQDVGPAMRSYGTVYRLQPSMHYKINNSISLFGGPSFNYYQSDRLSQQSAYKSIAFLPFYDEIKENKRHQLWLGVSLGLRFSINRIGKI